MTQPQTQKQRSLAHMPVTLFASVMGMASLTLAFKRAAHVWSVVPEWPYLVLLGLTALLFVVIAGAYLVKWARHPQAARAEMGHPIRMPFMSTITVALLLLATAGADVAPAVASVFWWMGAIGHLLATALILTAWFNRADITAKVITPAWLIPIVGNVITPLAAKQVGNVDFAWSSFGIGAILWFGFLPLILERLLTADTALPVKLQPMIAIMLAPPAVMLVSWTQLTGNADDIVTRMLIGVTWLFALALLFQAPRFLKMKYMLTFLAFTFPIGATAVASIVVAGSLDGIGYDIIAAAVLIIATVLILGIIVRTIVAAIKGVMFLPEE